MKKLFLLSSFSLLLFSNCNTSTPKQKCAWACQRSIYGCDNTIGATTDTYPNPPICDYQDGREANNPRRCALAKIESSCVATE